MGALELAIALLVAVPASRGVGLVLGATVIAVATATVLRHREFSHLISRRSAFSSFFSCWRRRPRIGA